MIPGSRMDRFPTGGRDGFSLRTSSLPAVMGDQNMDHCPPREFQVVETRHRARSAIALHRHAAPYLALVIEGSYEEYSVDGAWVCEPGDLVVHPAWHLHANRFKQASCTVRNFLWTSCDVSVMGGSASVLKLRDPAALMGNGQIGADALADAVARGEPRSFLVQPAAFARFASSLRDGPEAGVASLAAGMGMSREHVTRVFRRQFGLSPRDFRTEGRMRRALELIADPGVSLATAAYESGYSDQAHLTRCIRAATRMTPGQIRRQAEGGRDITFVQ
jgi:AraC family transcriptional regulator